MLISRLFLSLLSLGLIGEDFGFHSDQNTRICAEMDPYGYCIRESGDHYENRSGTAVLSAVKVVPVPNAVWLFGSALVALIVGVRRGNPPT